MGLFLAAGALPLVIREAHGHEFGSLVEVNVLVLVLKPRLFEEREACREGHKACTTGGARETVWDRRLPGTGKRWTGSASPSSGCHAPSNLCES